MRAVVALRPLVDSSRVHCGMPDRSFNLVVFPLRAGCRDSIDFPGPNAVSGEGDAGTAKAKPQIH